MVPRYHGNGGRSLPRGSWRWIGALRRSMMEEPQVRERAEAMCAALVAGDVGKATEAFSKELRQNLGEVVALLPLPETEGTVESIDRGGGSRVTCVCCLG